MKEQLENIIEELRELDTEDAKGLETFYVECAIEQLQMVIEETTYVQS